MSDEIKYCKFCNKEKPIKEFVKSGFAIKNICRECQNKKQAQIYRDSKKVKELEKENQELKKQLSNDHQIKMKRLQQENRKLKKQLSNSHQIKNQQKEFIEYLEAEKDRLARECSQIYEDSLGKTRLVSEDIFNELNDVLSKYKKIVGYKE